MSGAAASRAVVARDPDTGSEATTGLAPPGPRIDAALARIAAALRGNAPADAVPTPPRRRVLLRHSLAVPAAVRAGVAIAVALALGHLLRVGQPYWIALTVSAVLQGSTLVTSLRRGIERSAGTLVGILLAAGVAALDPDRRRHRRPDRRAAAGHRGGDRRQLRGRRHVHHAADAAAVRSGAARLDHRGAARAGASSTR